MSKLLQKNLAIQLRKKGLSYSEILKDIPVAKSTLSLWLREVGVAKKLVFANTQKRIDAAKRGALKRKQQRIDITKKITDEAAREIGRLDKKVFWMLGAALYWAEGAKQKEYNVATGTIFSNSDPLMIKFFYQWLLKICKVVREDIYFEIYIHQGCDVVKIKEFWSYFLKINIDNFDKIRYKPNKFKNYRRNIGEDYYGVVRIVVRKSANLNRKIMGWVSGACDQFIEK